MIKADMIRTVASVITQQWIGNSIISVEDSEAYQYGLELVLSTLLNVGIMFALSIAIGHTWLFVPYLISFIPLRLRAGGYHAQHHSSCILFNAVTYFVWLIAAIVLPEQAATCLCVMECGFSLMFVSLFAPVPARNKPLSEMERRRNRQISIGINSILLVLCILSYYGDALTSIGLRMLFYGQAASTVSLLFERVLCTVAEKCK